MHQMKMKKCEFIKNKVVQRLVTMNVDKERLIAHTDVIQFNLEGEDNVNVWRVRNQTHPNVINPNFPFTKYASSTCEGIAWAFMQAPNCYFFGMHQPYQ